MGNETKKSKTIEMDINILVKDEEEMFDVDSLMSLLDEISEQENELKAVVESEQNALVTSSQKADNSYWKDKLLHELGNDSSSEEVYVPQSMDEFPREIYSDAQLAEIETGIRHRINTRIYSDVKYSGRQMREIRYGLERGLNISLYANVLYRERQMKQIRIGLQDGLDVSSYASLVYSASDMKEKRKALFEETNKGNYDNLSYDYDDKETGIHIYVEPGLMEAGIVIKKKLPEDFRRFHLRKLMESYDIIYGFAEEELPENLSNLPMNIKIPVMYGKQPVKGQDGYYKINFEYEEDRKPSIREDGSVDYFTPKIYKKISKGDVVAEYFPSTFGEDGITVMGSSLPGQSGNEPEPIVCEDLLLSRDKTKYLSKKEGFLSVSGKEIRIMNFLQFDRDVTYMDGSINFDGNIKISGSVQNNVEIVSSGDIVITGYVDTAKLTAGRDIIISGGVNGDDTSMIIAKGNVTAGFLENACVKCGGNIEVGYLLNSDVTCNGTLITKGKKSLICGGSVVSGKGIDVGTVGSRNHAKTYIEVGDMEDDSEEYHKLMRQLDMKDSEIEKVHSVMDALLAKLGALEARQNESYIKFQDAISQLKKQREKIQEDIDVLEQKRLKRNETAIVIARNIYENTTVCVNGNKLLIREDKKGCTIKSSGRQVVIS